MTTPVIYEDIWHEDFPLTAQQMWDIAAKALMIRVGGFVTLTQDEMRAAANVKASMKFTADGDLEFNLADRERRTN